ncbi:unnamed protein product [Cercopithifilaria johnstoni]|uniref:Uncharacterized protein n=1 Tax=Cercopithifilaria johnstoni TaxID=2874296 RepID=A0A8J2MHJ5_9BILA|nr:unnamed protein product [Cercopithifilaria johnstoni]
MKNADRVVRRKFQRSISEDQFEKEKQLSENVNRSREEIRAILSARNYPSPRELLSLMCTSPTQPSSTCIAPEKIGNYRSVITSRTDMHTLSKKHSSSMNSSESASTAKKLNTIIDKFKTSFVRSGMNSKSATTKSFSRSESENFLKPRN